MMNPNYIKANDKQLSFTAAQRALGKRIVAVTGATGGLGTALCKQLALEGAIVVLIGRKLSKLEKLYDVLETQGDEQPAMLTLELDKAGMDECKAAAETLYSEFGKIDALVHCAVDAGTPTPQTLISDVECQRVMQVNLHAARQLTLAFLPLLKRSDLASTVFLLDHKPCAYFGTYGVSKAALHTFMCMVADENDENLNEEGTPTLVFNGYDPGPMRTPLRRRTFPGELEAESPPPELRLATLLSLLCRQDPSLTGVAVCNPEDQATDQTTA